MMSGATASLGMGNLQNNSVLMPFQYFFMLEATETRTKPLLKIHFDWASGSGSGSRKKRCDPHKKGKNLITIF
jgi:hypothetical protein